MFNVSFTESCHAATKYQVFIAGVPKVFAALPVVTVFAVFRTQNRNLNVPEVSSIFNRYSPDHFPKKWFGVLSPGTESKRNHPASVKSISPIESAALSDLTPPPTLLSK